MSLNDLKFATKFAGELDKMIVQKSATGFFADNLLRASLSAQKQL